MKEYAWTSFCVDIDKEYKRSQTFKDFAEGEEEAYFVFDLEKDFDATRLDFCVTVC